MPELLVTKADGTTEKFHTNKLIGSLVNAGAKEEVAHDIATEVVKNSTNHVTSQSIYRRAFAILKREHRPTAARYSLRRALFDLGPTGHPFEDLLCELFAAEGYTTTTRETVPGICVSHELDVLARKDGECIAVEAKFHNQNGTRTDTKVALYMHARMSDIFEYRKQHEEGCPVNRAMLITNTKFTRTAITYAECVDLELVGWDYPKGNSLLDRMNRLGLYPITALTRLSKSQKKELMKQGVVLCSKLEDHKDMLVTLGLSKEKMEDVLEEARALQQHG